MKQLFHLANLELVVELVFIAALWNEDLPLTMRVLIWVATVGILLHVTFRSYLEQLPKKRKRRKTT